MNFYRSRYLYALPLLVAFMLAAGCSGGKQDAADAPKASLIDTIKSGGYDVFSIPFDAYDGDLTRNPIGVFDSGIGGLTVLAEILKIDRFNNVTHERGADGRPDFENERFVYLGDQANMPYGNYPSEGKVDFLKELIIKDAAFILGDRYSLSAENPTPRHDKPPVKAIVIACNTATAYGLEDVRSALETWGIPIYLVGVVEAGAKGAVEALGTRGEGDVAVMATVGTCQSEGYPRAIEKAAQEAGIDLPGVIQQGSLGLAGAIEGDEAFITDPKKAGDVEYRGPEADNPAAPIDPDLAERYGFEADGLIGNPGDPWTWRLNSVENYVRYDTATLVENQRKKGGKPISTVILGCTHFPFHESRIAASFKRLKEFTAPDGSHPYAAVIADSIRFIDPSEITAEDLYSALAASGQLLGDSTVSLIPVDEFYISIPNPAQPGVAMTPSGGFTYEYKYGRTPGDFTAEHVLRVPMSGLNLSEGVRASIGKTMPEVWRRLIVFNESSPRTKDLPDSARLK